MTYDNDIIKLMGNTTYPQRVYNEIKSLAKTNALLHHRCSQYGLSFESGHIGSESCQFYIVQKENVNPAYKLPRYVFGRNAPANTVAQFNLDYSRSRKMTMCSDKIRYNPVETKDLSNVFCITQWCLQQIISHVY